MTAAKTISFSRQEPRQSRENIITEGLIFAFMKVRLRSTHSGCPGARHNNKAVAVIYQHDCRTRMMKGDYTVGSNSGCKFALILVRLI